MSNPDRPAEARKSPWMEKTLANQLSSDRDFPRPTPVSFQYAILCGHRMGSNMLSEALYETGMAGDPMEYFNLRMLQRLYEQRKVREIPFTAYIEEMKARRTSPNGVFGFNIKVDQFEKYFKDNLKQGIHFIKASDYVIFLTRRDKIRQAVSVYIGQCRDTFRIPADADYDQIKDIVSTVRINPAEIARLLQMILQHEQYWASFLYWNDIPHDILAYEDVVKDYGRTIDHILKRIGVAAADRNVPPVPTMNVSTPKNDELSQQFLALLNGDVSMMDLLVQTIGEEGAPGR